MRLFTKRAEFDRQPNSLLPRPYLRCLKAFAQSVAKLGQSGGSDAPVFAHKVGLRVPEEAARVFIEVEVQRVIGPQ
jgi:hypothetical protein